MPPEVERAAADIAKLDEARAVCADASVIYFCANPPYTRWPTDFPPLLEGAIEGAKTSGARLIVADNLYVYAPTTEPLTEDLPWKPATRKGRVRAAMDERLVAASRTGAIRMAIGRASDFFGPGALNTALIGEYFFKQYFAGKTVDWMGRLDVPHTYSYIGDFGRGLVTLGEHDVALGQVWHITADAPATGAQYLDMVFAAAGARAKIRRASKAALQFIGLFNPLMSEMAEMAYEFEQPYIMDGSKFARSFGVAPTPLPDAVATTVAWFRERMGAAGRGQVSGKSPR
jgi:nucleoside-diphosphate-sugar epimerase